MPNSFMKLVWFFGPLISLSLNDAWHFLRSLMTIYRVCQRIRLNLGKRKEMITFESLLKQEIFLRHLRDWWKSNHQIMLNLSESMIHKVVHSLAVTSDDEDSSGCEFCSKKIVIEARKKSLKRWHFRSIAIFKSKTSRKNSTLDVITRHLYLNFQQFFASVAKKLQNQKRKCFRWKYFAANWCFLGPEHMLRTICNNIMK